MPIGNLTSQHFANLYLNELDHFIKEKLKVKGYLRYMDDFILFDENKDFLQNKQFEVNEFLKGKLKLKLKENKCFTAPVFQGIPFLGFYIFKGTIRISKNSKERCKRKIKKRNSDYDKGKISEDKLIQSTSSLIGHIRHGNTFNLRKSWFLN